MSGNDLTRAQRLEVLLAWRAGSLSGDQAVGALGVPVHALGGLATDAEQAGVLVAHATFARRRAGMLRHGEAG